MKIDGRFLWDSGTSLFSRPEGPSSLCPLDLGDTATIRKNAPEHLPPSPDAFQRRVGPTIELMARGWESKSVEQQQEEAAAQRVHRTPLTPEQIAKENRRKGLELSRQRIVKQMEAASNPRHRQMLEAALADLNDQLHGLGSE